MFLLGVLAWTLTEYALHRYAHVINAICPHHVDPLDYSIGPPWQFNLGVAVAFIAACANFGILPFAGGFALGYVAYRILHYTMHHQPHLYWRGPRWLRALRRNHNVHHFIDDTTNYAVTSPLWDLVFGTYKGRP